MAGFIIINGMPGSGKSTLAKQLAQDLHIGRVSKDDIKELLGDALGLPGNEADNRRYGSAASDALLAIVNALADSDGWYIIESAFWADIASAQFTAIHERHKGASFIEIHVTCDHTTLTERFNARITTGARHAVHYDKLYAGDNGAVLTHRYRPLEVTGMECIPYDTTTTDAAAYKRLLDAITKWRDTNETTN